MRDRPLARRVEILELKMETLEALPARVAAVELQIVQLRTEMHGEFAAVRAEMRGMREELLGVTRTVNEETRSDLRGEIQVGDEETRSRLRAEIQASEEATRSYLTAEIQAGDEETRRLMRVLHEDVIARLALIQEGQRPRRKTDR